MLVGIRLSSSQVSEQISLVHSNVFLFVYQQCTLPVFLFDYHEMHASCLVCTAVLYTLLGGLEMLHTAHTVAVRF